MTKAQKQRIAELAESLRRKLDDVLSPIQNDLAKTDESELVEDAYCALRDACEALEELSVADDA